MTNKVLSTSALVLAVAVGTAFACLFLLVIAQKNSEYTIGAAFFGSLVVLPLLDLCVIESKLFNSRKGATLCLAGIAVLNLGFSICLAHSVRTETLRQVKQAERVGKFCSIHFSELDQDANAIIEDGELRAYLKRNDLREEEVSLATHALENMKDLGHLSPVGHGISRYDAKMHPILVKERLHCWR